MKARGKYFVKEDWIFNLESMNDTLHCAEYDIEDGKQALPVTIAGTRITDINDLDNLIEECSDLEWTAKHRKVTGSEYGRIRKIVEWRVRQRYFRCLANGMDERDAGECFSEL